MVQTDQENMQSPHCLIPRHKVVTRPASSLTQDRESLPVETSVLTTLLRRGALLCAGGRVVACCARTDAVPGWLAGRWRHKSGDERTRLQLVATLSRRSRQHRHAARTFHQRRLRQRRVLGNHSPRTEIHGLPEWRFARPENSFLTSGFQVLKT